LLFLLPKHATETSPDSTKLVSHARVAAHNPIDLRGNRRRQLFLQKTDYCIHCCRCFVFWQSRSFNQTLDNEIAPWMTGHS